MRFHRTDLMPLSHWPTLFLLAGYPVFWIEMVWFKSPGGHASPLAWVVVLLGLTGLVISRRDTLGASGQGFYAWVRGQPALSRLAVAAIIAVMAVFTAVSFYASLLPPHLMQELDAINYHITLPRQHLISGTFAHLPWSTADLYLLPVDFALAPFWLATALPNKLPQFFFLSGLAVVAVRLVFRLGAPSAALGFWTVCAVLGLHMVGIQAGTAMLDLVLCYLFLAAIDSFFAGNIVLSAMEFSFFCWAKSFHPLLCMAIVAGLGLGWAGARVAGFRCRWGFGESPSIEMGWPMWKRWLSVFAVASLIVGGPFVAKSVYYAGTPLFPIGAGCLKPLLNTSSGRYEVIRRKADEAVAARDQYAPDRGWRSFIGHFWLIAVPEKGVNNRYDYPVGLPYLLLLGPFLYFYFDSFRRKIFAILPALVTGYWGLWWCGSHQTRFLYVPIILMMVLVLARMPRRPLILGTGLVMALILTTGSVYRAHKPDFGKFGYAALRAEDKTLADGLQTSAGAGVAVLNRFDGAFAGFLMDVRGVESVFVLGPAEK
jgi:hypothetical protein